jgi:hypothetical protein
MMNLQENIHRIKQMMGIINEKIDIDDTSYVTMNIKNFPKYKEELKNIFKQKIIDSGGNFVKFKNSIISGYDHNLIPILSNEYKGLNNRYLNYMLSFGSKKFHSLLYDMFTDYYGNKPQKTSSQTEIINCDPSNFKILGPMTATDTKSLRSYDLYEEGGRVFKIKLPDECFNQLSTGERNIYVSIEPKENRIHFPKGVPERLRGKKLGTLIYLAMIKKLGFITSSLGNTAEIKMIYQDMLTNPKYEDDLMSLLLQKQVLIFDKNTTLDVKQIFNDFVANKFTDKKSVKISDDLKNILGDDFTLWYNSLEEPSEMKIEDKIKKYEGQEPKGGDTVVDTTDGKIYSFNGQYENNKTKEQEINLSNEKFEYLLLPATEKSRFKVIHRSNK